MVSDLSKELKSLSGIAMAFCLSACGLTDGTIGPDSRDPDLRGESHAGEVLGGAGPGNIIQLSASRLQENRRYNARGKLIIEGDLPSNISLHVKGELVILGNVGEYNHITVHQPIKQHSETETYAGICTKIGPDLDIGPNGIGYKAGVRTGFYVNCKRTHNFNDGLVYTDPDPAIMVKGIVPDSSKLKSYGGIEVDGVIVKPRQHLADSGISLEM